MKENSIPDSVKVAPINLQRSYRIMVDKCLIELSNSTENKTSDKKNPSLKLPIGLKKEEIYAQFKPSKNYIRLELHINHHELNDPQKICNKINSKYYSYWTYLNINEDSNLEYIFQLIKQAYEKIKRKSKVL